MFVLMLTMLEVVAVDQQKVKEIKEHNLRDRPQHTYMCICFFNYHGYEE